MISINVQIPRELKLELKQGAAITGLSTDAFNLMAIIEKINNLKKVDNNYLTGFTEEYKPEITSMSDKGFWIRFYTITGKMKHFYISFKYYPVFQTARIDEIYNFEQFQFGQFHWPDLDFSLNFGAMLKG